MGNKIIFTDQEIDKIKKLYLEDNMYIKDIAKIFNCSIPTITGAIKNNNIKKYPYKINYDLIIKDFKSGMSLTNIEKKYSYSRQSISIILKRMGFEIPNKQNELKFNNLVFDVIDTEEKAYWLGFIFADGYISSHKEGKKKKYAFELCVKGSDYNHMIKFNHFMEHKDLNIYNGEVKIDGKIFYRSRFCINNKHFWEVLNSYGCTPQKSLTLKFPDTNIFKSKELIRHFIRGYFDGDGCFSYSKDSAVHPIVSILGTKEFLTELQNNICNEVECKFGTKDKRRDSNTYVLNFNRKNTIKMINYLYGNSNIYLDRKYKLYQFFKNGCRSLEEFNELLSGKIEEPCDGNIEVNS